MSKIIDSKGNIFGALKLIEQLYLDGQIPGYIFRNIMKEYGNDIEVESFKCYANEAHEHDVHGAVANIAEHIDTLELGKSVSNCGKSLREYICSDDLHMVLSTAEGKSYQYSFSTRKRIYNWEDLNVTVWI